MLKLTSLALTLLTLVSIAPAAQAGLIFKGDSYNSQPAIKVIVNPQSRNQQRDEDCDDDRRNTKYNNSNYKKYQERQAAQRRREWEARREAYRRYQRGSGYYSNTGYSRDYDDRDDDYTSYYKGRDRH
jgi:hypothetical protein